MPNKNGTQAVADEKQAITVVDHEACGSQSGEAPNMEGLLKPGLSVESKMRVR